MRYVLVTCAGPLTGYRTNKSVCSRPDSCVVVPRSDLTVTSSKPGGSRNVYPISPVMLRDQSPSSTTSKTFPGVLLGKLHVKQGFMSGTDQPWLSNGNKSPLSCVNAPNRIETCTGEERLLFVILIAVTPNR